MLIFVIYSKRKLLVSRQKTGAITKTSDNPTFQLKPCLLNPYEILSEKLKKFLLM